MTEQLRDALTKALNETRMSIAGAERMIEELKEQSDQLRHDEAILAHALDTESGGSE